MPDITPTPFAKVALNERSGHFDRLLTQMSEAVLQDMTGFIHDSFPSVPVRERSAKYARYPREWFLRHGFKYRAPNTVAGEVTHEVLFDRSYSCDVFSSRVAIDNQTAANVSAPVDPEAEAVRLLMHHSQMFKEAEWVNRFFVTGQWGTEQAGVASGPTGTQYLRWDDANSDPIGDVDAAKDDFRENTGLDCNEFLMQRRVFTALKNHPDVIARIQYNFSSSGASPVMATPQTLAALFGVERIRIGQAIHDTGNMGATLDTAFIVGKHALLLHNPGRFSLMSPIAGMTWSWTGYDAGMNNLGMGLRRYYNEERQTSYIEAQLAFDMTISTNILGHFFLNAVS